MFYYSSVPNAIADRTMAEKGQESSSTQKQQKNRKVPTNFLDHLAVACSHCRDLLCVVLNVCYVKRRKKKLLFIASSFCARSVLCCVSGVDKCSHSFILFCQRAIFIDDVEAFAWTSVSRHQHQKREFRDIYVLFFKDEF